MSWVSVLCFVPGFLISVFLWICRLGVGLFRLVFTLHFTRIHRTLTIEVPALSVHTRVIVLSITIKS